MTIPERLRQLHPELIELRRDLHAHPETAFQEERTSDIVNGGCMLHSPHYDFNDDLLPLGASYWVRLAEHTLGPA